jgi:hypothetical protein
VEESGLAAASPWCLGRAEGKEAPWMHDDGGHRVEGGGRCLERPAVELEEMAPRGRARGAARNSMPAAAMDAPAGKKKKIGGTCFGREERASERGGGRRARGSRAGGGGRVEGRR